MTHTEENPSQLNQIPSNTAAAGADRALLRLTPALRSRTQGRVGLIKYAEHLDQTSCTGIAIQREACWEV